MEDPILLVNYAIAFFSLFTTTFFLLLFLKHRETYNKPLERTGWRPGVSIVIAAHNEEEYIGDTLKSILNLDYPKEKLEIIVVDDGSTDRTVEIVKEYESEGVRVYSKEQGGKGSALNYGIRKATMELVATMDADSYLTEGALLDLLPHFENDKKVMAVTPAVKVKGSKSLIKEMQRIEYLMILFSRKLLSYIDSVPVTPGPFSIFRRNVFDEVGYFDEANLVEDQEMALRIQAHNYRIKSSMTADVYTEPPGNMADFIKQRVRWQRGGLRNYWRYRNLIKPEYGDFGMFFVPLNFASITAFFVLLALLVNAVFSTPYYARYIFVESLGMSISFFTIIGTFVVLITIAFLHVAITSFKGEKVSIPSLVIFIIMYWYFMICYNVLTLVKEVRREKCTW